MAKNFHVVFVKCLSFWELKKISLQDPSNILIFCNSELYTLCLACYNNIFKNLKKWKSRLCDWSFIYKIRLASRKSVYDLPMKHREDLWRWLRPNVHFIKWKFLKNYWDCDCHPRISVKGWLYGDVIWMRIRIPRAIEIKILKEHLHSSEKKIKWAKFKRQHGGAHANQFMRDFLAESITPPTPPLPPPPLPLNPPIYKSGQNSSKIEKYDIQPYNSGDMAYNKFWLGMTSYWLSFNITKSDIVISINGITYKNILPTPAEFLDPYSLVLI